MVQYADALPGGPLQVHVYGGSDGSFDLIEDDGESEAYLAGKKRVTSLQWHEQTQTLSWAVSGTVATPEPEQLYVEVQLKLFTPGGGHYTSPVKQLGKGGSIVAKP